MSDIVDLDEIARAVMRRMEAGETDIDISEYTLTRPALHVMQWALLVIYQQLVKNGGGISMPHGFQIHGKFNDYDRHAVLLLVLKQRETLNLLSKLAHTVLIALGQDPGSRLKESLQPLSVVHMQELIDEFGKRIEEAIQAKEEQV